MLEQAGRFDLARETVEAALREDLNNVPARVRLALLLCRKRDFSRAASEFRRAESAYEKDGNIEGLSDLLLTRFSALTGQNPEQDRQDVERVRELSGKTGNRFHALSARFQMAKLAERERDYDHAMAVAREAAQQATREGMPVVAARAMGELGYAFGYAKKWPEAVAILQDLAEMAERAGSPATVASNRMKLGEALGSERHIKEAIEVMGPAVEWYRHYGSEDILPLILMKWGTALNGMRFDESVKTFKEALDLAERRDDKMYQSMALQRLASAYAARDLREAGKYWDRTVVLARQTHLTGAYIQAARSWQHFGEFGKTANLIAEAEREIAALYAPGVDRDHHVNSVILTRAELHYFQGHCVAGLRIASELKKRDQAAEMLWRRLQACAGSNTLALRQDSSWFEAQLGRVDMEDLGTISRLTAGAGDVALRLGDWRSAKRYAERGLEADENGRLLVDELENLLVLRAANRGLRNAASVGRLRKRVLQVAAQVGFDPPEQFGGRRDLLRLWR